MRLPAIRAAAGVAVAAMVGTASLTGCSILDPTEQAGSSPARSGALATTPTDPAPTSVPQPESRELLSSAQALQVASWRNCILPRRAFRPRTARVPGQDRAAQVLALHRNADGTLGMPPLTTEGKQKFAWDLDQGIRPGDPQGNVLFTAHTYPDGSALGNRLLAHLHVGDKIVLRGKYSRQRLCYRVVDRVKVAAGQRYPRFYSRGGPPRLAIAACSGRRLGPGHWSQRTVWFAKPVYRR